MDVALGLGATTLVIWLRLRRQFEARELPVTPQEKASTVQSWFDSSCLALGTRFVTVLHMSTTESKDLRLLARMLMLAVLLIPFLGVGAFVLLVGVAAGVEWKCRKRPEARKREANRDLGLVTDLLGIALASGCNLFRGMEILLQALERTRFDDRYDELTHQLRTVLREVSVGKSSEEALLDFGRRCGGDTSRLVGALVASERHGTPIAQSLEQISFEMRLRQQRELEQRAKRASVALAFPLAGCVLPAFALLTVVPLLAGSLGSLAISIT